MPTTQWDDLWIAHIRRQITAKRSEVGSLRGHLANAEAQLERLKKELADATAKPPT